MAQEKNGEDKPKMDPQKQYLIEQFGNLMEKVGEGYGGPLQEELIRRLEQTVADFDEEVNEMMESLKENSVKRHEKLKEIWVQPDDGGVSNGDTDASDQDGPAMDDDASEWEKRLEGQETGDSESGNENPDEKEEVPKKKGLFGRKKK